MKANMGITDRMIRILIAAVLAIMYSSNIISGTLGYVLMVLAAIMVITSFISFCPLYLPFGINTGAKNHTTKHKD